MPGETHKITPIWTESPLYSKLVHDWTGIHKPYQQCAVLAVLVGGTVFAVRSYSRTYHLLRATQQIPESNSRAVHKALAWASEEQVQSASVLARVFDRTGATTAWHRPLIYLAYLHSRHTAQYPKR